MHINSGFLSGFAPIPYWVLQVDADDKYWDTGSEPQQAELKEPSSVGRPWWQASYSLRIWGPEFLPIQPGELSLIIHPGSSLRRLYLHVSSSSC